MNRQIAESITEKLNAIYPDYQAKIADGRREKIDWELCGGGIFTEVELLKTYADSTGLTAMEEEDIGTVVPLPEFSLDYLNTWCCLPWRREESALEIFVCDPYHLDRHRYFFKRLFGWDTEFVLIRRSELERMIAVTYRSSNAADEFGPETGDDEETLRNLASEAKIVRLVNEMFTRAAEQRASDIHVEPEENQLIIRFRIDGILHEYMICPLTQYPAIASRIKLIGGLNIAESRLPQDGRTNIQLARSDMDIRISTIPTMNGESIVLRLLKKDAVSFDLRNVGMLDAMREKFEKMINIPHGIILVVGPTGSGKTTTLYSVISQLNDHKKKIITIEDPVEYRLDRLSQMQVNAKIGLTFANGLRHIVRQDPDVILVGEIRDRETADIAINAALTGHLVLSTLHTNDAAGAVSRLIDMGVEGFLLASALYGVLSQRLVRQICSHCNGSGIDHNRTGNKCRECSGTGFHGRTGIFELLTVDEDVRRAISTKASSGEIAAIAQHNGMRPILEDGLEKVELGITTETEVRRSSTEC